MGAFSAALCRGLIEAAGMRTVAEAPGAGFPRLYAAASLKLGCRAGRGIRGGAQFSAALCRGLIEAGPGRPWGAWRPSVFRGFMPRPH